MTSARERATRTWRPAFAGLHEGVFATFRAAAVTFVCVAMTARALAQQPTFRSGARLIVEDVTVKDKDGHAVEGLTARDFIVTEDDLVQPIDFVEFQSLSTSSRRPE